MKKTLRQRITRMIIQYCFILVILVFTTILGGCTKKPSSNDVKQAIRDYYSSRPVAWIPFQIIHCPPGFKLSGVYKEVNVQQVRIIKFGKLGKDSGIWPVRVRMKGTFLATIYTEKEGPFKLTPIVNEVKNEYLSFDGEAEFTVRFEPTDLTRVDPVPGYWIAKPLD